MGLRSPSVGTAGRGGGVVVEVTNSIEMSGKECLPVSPHQQDCQYDPPPPPHTLLSLRHLPPPSPRVRLHRSSQLRLRVQV